MCVCEREREMIGLDDERNCTLIQVIISTNAKIPQEYIFTKEN